MRGLATSGGRSGTLGARGGLAEAAAKLSDMSQGDAAWSRGMLY
mgnify:CR=1 FL=1